MLPFALVAAVVLTGQLGGFRASPRAALGVAEGRLAAPSDTPNSVSSQADWHANHPQQAYARIAPFRPVEGESMSQAWTRLGEVVRRTPDVAVVAEETTYLRAEARTRWLRFVDDVELLRADATGVIHVRSASRLGRKDFGVNRERIETWRAAFEAGASPRPPSH